MTKAKQVFISHAKEDAPFAHRLADDLRKLGVQVWIAPGSIRPGESWVDAIERGLGESSHTVVVLTPKALKSRWVKKETGVAIAQERKGRIRVIPLDVEPCAVPLLLSSYQMVSFRDDYDAGLSQLADILGLRVTPPEPVHLSRHAPPPGTVPEPEVAPPPLVEPVAVPKEKAVPFWQKVPLWGWGAVGAAVLLIAAGAIFLGGQGGKPTPAPVAVSVPTATAVPTVTPIPPTPTPVVPTDTPTPVPTHTPTPTIGEYLALIAEHLPDFMQEPFPEFIASLDAKGEALEERIEQEVLPVAQYILEGKVTSEEVLEAMSDLVEGLPEIVALRQELASAGARRQTLETEITAATQAADVFSDYASEGVVYFEIGPDTDILEMRPIIKEAIRQNIPVKLVVTGKPQWVYHTLTDTLTQRPWAEAELVVPGAKEEAIAKFSILSRSEKMAL